MVVVSFFTVSVVIKLSINLSNNLWHHASHHHTHQAHWEIAFEVERADILDMKIFTFLSKLLGLVHLNSDSARCDRVFVSLERFK